MTTDLSLSSAQQVLELIKQQNAVELDFTQVSFGTPTSLTGDVSEKNTRLTVNSQPNGGYVGSVDTTYNRLDMEGLLAYGPGVISIPVDGDKNDFIQALNAQFGTNITLLDDVINDFDLPEIDYDGTSVTVVAKASSYAYIGNIDLTVKFPQSPLSSIITNTVFNGLRWPAVEGPVLLGTIQNLTGFGELRRYPITCVGDNKMWVLGGNSGGSTNHSNVRYYDFVTGQWDTQAYPNAAQTTTTSGLRQIALYNGKLIRLNGNMRRELNLTTKTWANVAFPSGRVFNQYGVCAFKNGIFYVVAGDFNNTSQSLILSSFNVNTNTIVEHGTIPLMDAADNAFLQPTLELIDDYLYLLGGRYGNATLGYRQSKMLHKWHIPSQTWSRCADCPVTVNTANSRFSSAVANNLIYIYGGDTIENPGSVPTNGLYVYSPNDDHWSFIANVGIARDNHGLEAYGNKLYAFGGENTANDVLGDLVAIS